MRRPVPLFVVFAFVFAAVLANVTDLTRSAAAQSLEIAGEPASAGAAVSIESFTVRATVEEGTALVDLEQVFRNGGDRVREGVWTIRLPDDAVVHTFSMWMDGKEKQGRVLEAGRARAIYDSIVRERKDPALLEEIGWRTFRVSVFPIPARDTVKIRLRYAHVIPDDLGLANLRIPLPTSQGEVAVLDVAADIAVAAGIGVCDVPSPAGASIAVTPGRAAIRWSRERFRPTEPFAVRFAPKPAGFGLSLLAHRAADDPQGAFLVRLVPHLDTAPDLPRDVVFVVDRSGSMQGRKIEQARAALRQGLATLRPADRFAVVTFASDVTASAMRVAAPENVVDAQAAAAVLEATGGTNIDGALQSALALRADAPERLFVVVLLTDGDPTFGVTHPDLILANWRDRSRSAAGGATTGRPAGPNVRLFALGVGDDVKDFLLTRLARGSRGAAEYVRNEEKLETKLSALFEKVRTPLLTDVEITVEGVPVVSVEPRPLPDAFRGGSVVLAGRFIEGGRATLVLKGRQGTTPVEVRVPVEFPTAPVARPHVAQLWARMRIDRLLDDLRAAGSGDNSGEIRGEITALGLKHQVVSPFTSFLVVEDGVHIPDDRETARVPDAPRVSRAGGPTTGGGSGHGGSYRGPGGSVPADSREPSDPPPSPEGGGPGTPGGQDIGGPTTGGGDTGGPPPSGGGARVVTATDGQGGVAISPYEEKERGKPTGSGAHAFRGGAGRAAAQPGYEEWTHWWEAEADGLLLDAGGAAPPPLDAAVVATQVLPRLRAVTDDANENWIVRSGAIEALARSGDRRPEFLAWLAALQRGDAGGGENRLIEEFAILAPLWMDDRSAPTRDRLLSAVADPGRRGFVRPYAAVTLGLLGEKDGGRVARALVAAIEAPTTSENLRPACLLALGFLRDASVVPTLLARLDDAGSTDTEIAYGVEALGRIGSPGALDAVGRSSVAQKIRAILVTDGPAVPRRSAPGALTRLYAACGTSDRQAIVEALIAKANDFADPSTCGAACLALGRIAAMDSTEPGVRARIVRVLAERPTTRPSTVVAEYAWLGLGLAARGAARDAALPVLRSDTPRDSLRRPWSPVRFVALGLARDPASAAPLATAAGDTSIPLAWRSRAVLAAVCCDAGVAAWAPDLVDPTDGFRSDAWDAIRAAGLGGAPAAATVLPAILESEEWSQLALHLAMRGVGRTGGDDVVARLVAVLDPARHSDMTRSMAVRALGRMASRRADPLDRITDGFPYRAHVPALAELHRIATGR